MIEQHGGVAVPCAADVADAADTERLIATAVDAFDGLDALFNNAGTIRPGTAVKLPPEHWDFVMAVNVRSVFLGAKYAVPVMADRGGGAIVSTASVSGLAGDPTNVVYSASKAPVIKPHPRLPIDHARQQIRVNCICPGAIDTPPVGRMLAAAGARERAAKATRSGASVDPTTSRRPPCSCARRRRRGSPARRSWWTAACPLSRT